MAAFDFSRSTNNAVTALQPFWNVAGFALGAVTAAIGPEAAMACTAAVETEIDLGKTGEAFFLQARLNVSLPGLEPSVAHSLVEAAHQTCPYSKATRGNIEVEVNVLEPAFA